MTLQFMHFFDFIKKIKKTLQKRRKTTKTLQKMGKVARWQHCLGRVVGHPLRKLSWDLFNNQQ
ncbi:Uncharacterized protein APZ42_027661 [Daphnia magna]|uniref:Uncharacterized protein n=1 Tax=Daphnia magna TaxID=35525 RepID=A0A164R5S6_9CRUS|nr:Uncharacterized protein APZ42_027661 [Daphnia magna]